jgi:superfamily II RNA helicase
MNLKGAVNAQKREAQKAWSMWENTHMGPRWASVSGLWPAYKESEKRVQKLRNILDSDEPGAGVWPSLAALAEMGFLEKPVGPDLPLILTPMGTMATEVNEGHAILMTQAYSTGIMKGFSGEEVLAVLAGFMQESGDMPAVDGLNIPKKCIEALWSIHRLGQGNQGLEKKVGAPMAPKDEFWSVNTIWIEPVWRWLQGDTTQELCTDYEIYEGNLLRMLMKMVNILEEWRSLATLASDTEMLETMRDYEQRLLNGIAVCDSLYLRI